jgi:hypothetical protein
MRVVAFRRVSTEATWNSVALLSAFEIPSLVCTYKVLSWNDINRTGGSQGTDHQAINHHIHTDGANRLLIIILLY